MQPKRYATAAAFRRALEDRLQDIAGKESVDLQRLRRKVAFDRLLGRLFRVGQSLALPWVLKGGYAMELRIKAARTTKDIDLTMRSASSSSEKQDDKKNLVVLEKLQEAAAFRGDDFFVYTIGEPISDLDAAPYGGARFPVEARLDGRVFVGFHLDVGIGDAVVDMVLLIQSGTMAIAKVAEAIRVTFDRRRTHTLPKTLLHPSTDWRKPFEALAKECRLSEGIDDAFVALEKFLSEGEIVEATLKKS